MQPVYLHEGTQHAVTPLRLGDAIELEVDGHRLDAQLSWHDAHSGELVADGCRYPFHAAQDGNVLHIHLAGRAWRLDIQDEFAGSAARGASAGVVHAPMPGVVVEVGVAVGDTVEPGQGLMLIESMKLQTEIRSAVAGTVTALGAGVGDSFDKGAMLVDIELGAGD